MGKISVFPMGESPALAFAAQDLAAQGVSIATELTPHVTHLLLSVPSKETDLSGIPTHIPVIGGNLRWVPDAYSKVDLLQDPVYLAENAAITAECALRLLSTHLPISFHNCPILVIGWGRIGKCLGQKLKQMGANVHVAARKAADLAILSALGYVAVNIHTIAAEDYCAVINTVPAPVLRSGGEGVYIDLASCVGITGENVLWARGLPGQMLPKASGALIAQRVMRYLQEGTL